MLEPGHMRRRGQECGGTDRAREARGGRGARPCEKRIILHRALLESTPLLQVHKLVATSYEKAEVELRPVPERHSWSGLELGLGAVRVRVPCRRGTPVGGKRMAVRVRG